MKLGYLDDPVLAIYTLEGELLDSADDRLQQNGSQPPNLDPYLVHKFEKAGRYIVAIRDSAERGSPNYVYRLAIYPVEPDFDLQGLTRRSRSIAAEAAGSPCACAASAAGIRPSRSGPKIWAPGSPRNTRRRTEGHHRGG
jgi:hypothetical protein